MKMKVKVLSRNLDECLRETKKDIQKVPRNYDGNLHPFDTSREYIRALNAAKLERVFAKPFLGSLDGHRDIISSVTKHPQTNSLLYSGSCDGEIRIWNLGRRKCIGTVVAHDGAVQGMCFNPRHDYFYSCGNDKIIKQWKAEIAEGSAAFKDPINTIITKTLFRGMDHHYREDIFATCGDQLDIWDESKCTPYRSYSEVNGFTSVQFNQSEETVVGTTCIDRAIRLFDIRHPDCLRQVVLEMRSNCLSWNPVEPIYFTVANEDYNLYTFDIRNLKSAINVHMGHVSAVLSVDYSPTGREFVSGSYDRTIRIFPSRRGNSRDVYHTKRMQRVVDVKWTWDNRFLVSASDEMNLRVWKANASEKLGVLRPREKEAFNYSAKLKKKFSSHPQVSRIIRHRHVPNAIYAATKEIRIIKDSMKKKESRRRARSKPGAVPHLPERQKCVLKEVE